MKDIKMEPFGLKPYYPIRDGFYIETFPNRWIDGHSYYPTEYGHYSNIWVIGIEDELYFYNNENEHNYKKMYNISGAYVKALSKIEIEVKQDLNKAYPIEIYLGGKIGIIKLYCYSRVDQDKWIGKL
jgi:hypothetical protein